MKLHLQFFIILIFAASAFAQQSKIITAGETYYLSNTLIVKLKDSPAAADNISLPQSLQNYLRSFELSAAKMIFPSKLGEAENPLNRIIEIKYNSNADPLFLSKKISQLKDVEWAEPRFAYEVDYIPNDPNYAAQYALIKINAAQAWDISKGDTNIVIGIVDTGVDWDHPDLAANIWINHNEIPGNGIDDDNNGFIDDIRGWDFGGLNGIPDNNPMEDRPDHGTHVAGIASAVTDNGIGVASIGFNCKIMAVKTSQDDYRNPNGQALIPYGFEGIVYAADNGAKIINCSWGGSGFSILGQETINQATQAGALVVCAAGNSNSSTAFYPASYDKVLSVASTNQGDMKSSFSNYGVTVDVSAPGQGIYGTWQNDTYATLSGTSMASPLAAGLAALVASQFPAYNPLQIGEQVRVNCDDINTINPNYANLLGKGRINAYKALNNTNSIAVRAVDIQYSDEAPGGNGDGIFQAGETIKVKINFVNYLNSTSSLNIYLENKNSYSTIGNAIFNVGSVATLEAFNNHDNPFTFTLNQGIPQNADLLFQINFIDGSSYLDFQATKTIGNPTYATHAGNDVALTITSKGTLGFNDFPNNFQGTGFSYLDGDNLLFEGALILGTSASKISDAARSTGSNQSNDFSVVKPFTLSVPGFIADVEGSTIFNDNAAGSNKIGITSNLTSYTYANSPHENYIILRYDLINTGPSAVANLYAGLFFDWDLIDGSGADDITSWDSSKSMGYAYHFGGNPDTWVGTALISDNNYGFWAINNAGGDGGFQIYDGFSDAEKWQSISSGLGKLNAGAGDISHVISGGPYSINPGDTVDVAFMVAAGIDHDHLKTTVDFARQKYQEILITDVDYEASAVSMKFSLEQNFPNPFNPKTNLRFRIADFAFVTLKIYDVLGKEIAILINEEKQPGEYEINFDASQLTSGVYFYKLTAGSYTSSKKMVILK